MIIQRFSAIQDGQSVLGWDYSLAAEFSSQKERPNSSPRGPAVDKIFSICLYKIFFKINFLRRVKPFYFFVPFKPSHLTLGILKSAFYYFFRRGVYYISKPNSFNLLLDTPAFFSFLFHSASHFPNIF